MVHSTEMIGGRLKRIFDRYFVGFLGRKKVFLG